MKRLDNDTHTNLINTTRNSIIRSQVEADVEDEEEVSDDDGEVKKNHKYGNNQFYQKFYNESIELYEKMHTYEITDRAEVTKLLAYLRKKMKLSDQDFTLDGNPINKVRARSIKARDAITTYFGPEKAKKMLRYEQNLEEKTLSEPELKKREDIVKKRIKKNLKLVMVKIGSQLCMQLLQNTQKPTHKNR
jgi:hypothetical protein